MDQAPAQMELIRTRKAGIQDEGSQLVAHLFYQAAQGAESILDICSGPGGKAALLSHLAARDGKSFVGNEISSKRAELVKQVTANHDVWVGDGRRISERGINFDAVLADVPCTGIGALRRRPEVRWRRRVSDLRELTQLQSETYRFCNFCNESWWDFWLCDLQSTFCRNERSNDDVAQAPSIYGIDCSTATSSRRIE
jgi:16S rRNA (cytosine967-C5)-methyltransferase